MALNTLAIDIGKHSFHLFGIDDDGVIVSRKVSRLKLVATVDRLDPKIIAMEACGSAHHWGRMFQEAGRMVRLISPYFVRPFVRGSKNDATDAQAIFEAAGRPTMRFVPVKSLECQDLQSLHRIRDRLVHNRTSLINHTRGLLAEYGIVLPQGAKRFTLQVRQAVVEAELSDLARELFEGAVGSARGSRSAHRSHRQAPHCNLPRQSGLSAPCRHPWDRSRCDHGTSGSCRAGSSGRVATWLPGSAWCHANIRRVANRGSAGSVGELTTICVDRSCTEHEPS